MKELANKYGYGWSNQTRLAYSLIHLPDSKLKEEPSRQQLVDFGFFALFVDWIHLTYTCVEV